MRILVTGMNTFQMRSDKITVHKFDVFSSIADLLRRMGHDVTHRAFDLDEDVKDYDAAFIGLSSFASPYGAVGFARSARLIHEFAAAGKPLSLYYDDWSIRKFHADVKLFNKQGIKQLLKTLAGAPLYGHSESTLLAHKRSIFGALELLAARLPANVHAFYPAYRHYGNKDILFGIFPGPREQYHIIDPSNLFCDYELLEKTRDEFLATSSTRNRRWSLCTLVKQTEWTSRLHGDWRIDFFGTRTLGVPRLPTELDVFKINLLNIGALIPPYQSIVGSGWWRVRFIYAAYAGAVASGEYEDLKHLHKSYWYSVREVEAMTDDQRAAVAAAQAESFLPLLDKSPEKDIAELAMVYGDLTTNG